MAGIVQGLCADTQDNHDHDGNTMAKTRRFTAHKLVVSKWPSTLSAQWGHESTILLSQSDPDTELKQILANLSSLIRTMAIEVTEKISDRSTMDPDPTPSRSGTRFLLSDSATLLCQIAFSLRPCARLHTQPMTVHSNLSTFHSYILPYRPVLKHNAYCVLYVLPTRCKTVQKLRLDYWRILRDQEVVHRTSHFCSHHHEAGRGFSMLSAIRMLIRCRLICNSNFTAEMFPDASYVVGRYMKSLFTLQLN